MKRNTTMLLLGIIFPFLTTSLYAQDVLVVDPGVGTLNAAIAEHGGNKVYELKAGQWYQIDAIIENDGYHLQIIGEDPGDGMPATLQTNADATGAVFNKMFDAKGNLTLKNIYFVNADLTGVVGERFMDQSGTDARTIINNCVLHPAAWALAISLESGNNKVYFTDNIAVRHGHQLNPNCGHFFVTGHSGLGFDTLYVENNTFVSMGTNMHAGEFSSIHHNYSRWNHNTIIHQKSQIDWASLENEYYWTNNLMFDVQTQPWAVTWQPMPGHHADKPKPSLIYADTIPGEVMPSSRIQYVQYNLHYRNPGFYALIDELNELAVELDKPQMYLMPLLWPEDSAEVSREVSFFHDDENFPKWKYGNTYYGVDPVFEDERIYEHSDWLVEWTRPASMQHAMGLPADQVPPTSEWTQWHWIPDDDISLNETWPVFNGRYTNPEILTASIAGLPLGDLNWFPEAKAIWEQYKDLIDDHMRAANEERLLVTSSEEGVRMEPGVFVYPNPARDIIRISQQADLVEVYSITGSLLKTERATTQVNLIELPTGVYFVRVHTGNSISSHKIVLSR